MYDYILKLIFSSINTTLNPLMKNCIITVNNSGHLYNWAAAVDDILWTNKKQYLFLCLNQFWTKIVFMCKEWGKHSIQHYSWDCGTSAAGVISHFSSNSYIFTEKRQREAEHLCSFQYIINPSLLMLRLLLQWICRADLWALSPHKPWQVIYTENKIGIWRKRNVNEYV